MIGIVLYMAVNDVALTKITNKLLVFKNVQDSLKKCF